SSASTRGVLSWNNSATGGTSNGVNLYQSSGSLVVRLMDTAGAMRQNASVLGTFDGQWRHVALTYDRTTGTAREYLDGVLKVAENVGIFTPQTSYDFYLGNYAGASATFSGQLDEVSLYARPLNPQEVYAIYTSGSVGKCPEDDNQTPWVYAGPDRIVGGTNGSAQLEGEVADDGLPTGSILRAQWSKFTGPGSVTFADPASPFTTATFTAPGIYVLQLTADDSSIQNSDRVEVRVESLCTIEDPQGLVAWWPANGTTREVLNDQAGILANGTTYSTGKVAAAFQFDGTNDFVFVPAQTNYDVGSSTAGFTLEFWTKAVSSASTRGVLAWNNSATGGTSNGVYALQSNGSLLVRLVDTAGVLRQNASVLGTFDGQWRHVAVTYDRTTGVAREYLDGVLKVTENVGVFTPQTSYDFYLGNYAGASTTFSGQLDELSLYARPLN